MENKVSLIVIWVIKIRTKLFFPGNSYEVFRKLHTWNKKHYQDGILIPFATQELCIFIVFAGLQHKIYSISLSIFWATVNCSAENNFLMSENIKSAWKSSQTDVLLLNNLDTSREISKNVKNKESFNTQGTLRLLISQSRMTVHCFCEDLLLTKCFL